MLENKIVSFYAVLLYALSSHARQNRIIFIHILLLCLCSTSCNNHNKILYINSNQLIQGYHGAIAQHEVFQAKATAWQQRVDSLKIELQNLNNSSAGARSNKEQQLLRYRDAIQQQAQEENQRLTKAVLDEINAYIKQYGKDHGYSFILGATNAGNIVYAAEGTDISDDVLKGLNAQYDRQHPNQAR